MSDEKNTEHENQENPPREHHEFSFTSDIPFTIYKGKAGSIGPIEQEQEEVMSYLNGIINSYNKNSQAAEDMRQLLANNDDLRVFIRLAQKLGWMHISRPFGA